MECKDCGGEVNMEMHVSLMTGCSGCGGGISKPAAPCMACGRLHWIEDGEPTFNRGANPAYYDAGKVVIKHVKTGEVLLHF